MLQIIKKFLDHIPFTYNDSNIGEAKWHGNNMTAGKYNSCAFGLDANVTEVDFRDRIDALPSQWVADISPSGDPIMTYTFQIQGDNLVNYQLYYFVNKSKK